MKRTSRPDDKPSLVLIVEDDENSAELLRTFVESQGFGTAVANSLADARQQLVLHTPSVILLDLHLPDGSGMDLFDDESLRGDSDIILITGNASVETSVQALRLGAADYLIKPVSLKVLRNVFARLHEGNGQAGADPAEGRARAEVEPTATSRFRPLPSMRGDGEPRGAEVEAAERNGAGRPAGEAEPTAVAPAQPANGQHADGPLIQGHSELIREVMFQIGRVARTSVSVFIVGESGTGKELVAESVHRASRRRNGPFEAINCGAISAQLIESELFGHEKGSFTGAIRQHKGFFERASGGTLFLDEITEMSLDLQVKLLRVLETGTFSRVGSDSLLRSDVRIIAATNRDPFRAIGEGRLREDLYYRLNVFQILLPPLRERLEDIPELAVHFMARFGEQEGGRVPRFAAPALAAMQRYNWPGNVRELRNFIHRAAILADGDLVEPEDLPPFGASLPRGDGLRAGLAPAPVHGEPPAAPLGTLPPNGTAGHPASSGINLPAMAGMPGMPGAPLTPALTRGGTVERLLPSVTVAVGSTIADMERALILATLEHCGGAKERSAEILGISLKTLYNRLRSYEG